MCTLCCVTCSCCCCYAAQFVPKSALRSVAVSTFKTLAEAQNAQILTTTHRNNNTLTRTNKHTPSCYYLKPKSLSHISACIHISVKAAERLPAPMNSHYQSIWTGLSSAGTSPKSHFTPSTSSDSVPHSVPHWHYQLLAEIKSSHHTHTYRRSEAAQCSLFLCSIFLKYA